MRILFMGTPAFAVPSLRALLDRGHEIAAVVTQPDRPAGRGQAVRRSAVKELAEARGLAVLQPAKLRDPEVVRRLAALAPELVAVAAYGKILPPALLELAPRGAVNVHGSLLPRWRGAAPIQRAILAGDPVTGITIMQMNERMDEGDVLLRRELAIRPDDTTESLSPRLAELGAAALVEALDRLEAGTLAREPQSHADATLAPMVRKEEGEIDWRRGAAAIERATRAFHPWPGAWTRHRGRLLKLFRATPQGEASHDEPGSVLRASPEGIDVATGDGVLRVLELQPEGRRRMAARDLLAGRGIAAGDRLG